MTPKHQEIMSIVSKKLDRATAEIIRSALENDARMSIIRDAFLEGRDHEAVTLIREMDPVEEFTMLGMNSAGTIPAAGSCFITARPQATAFHPKRLLVSSSCAANFAIEDIKVGNCSQLLAYGSLAADFFSEDIDSILDSSIRDSEGYHLIRSKKPIINKFGVALKMDVVMTSQDLVLQVTNLSGGYSTFRAAFLGVKRPDMTGGIFNPHSFSR